MIGPIIFMLSAQKVKVKLHMISKKFQSLNEDYKNQKIFLFTFAGNLKIFVKK